MFTFSPLSGCVCVYTVPGRVCVCVCREFLVIYRQSKGVTSCTHAFLSRVSPCWRREGEGQL